MQAAKFTAGKTTLAILLVAVGMTSASAQSYRLINIGETESRAYGMNRFGQAAGWVRFEDNHHGARWFETGELADIEETSHLVTNLVFNLGYSEAFDISDAGQIVGAARKEIRCTDGTITVTTGFVLRPATVTDFGTVYPGDALTDLSTFGNPCSAFNSAATAVSNRYHVVGWAEFDFTGLIHAMLVEPQDGNYYLDNNDDLVNDLMIDLGALGRLDSVSGASDVNDDGIVIGYSYVDTDAVTNAAFHAFRWQAGAIDGVAHNPEMKDLGTLGGTNSWGRGINNAGQIVGESDTATGQTHAFIWENGTMTSLGTLGGDNSSAAAINELGQVVGWAETADGEKHAFLWEDGLMVDLNDLLPSGVKLALTEARDINSEGQIVGWGTDRSSTIVRAFFITPTDGNDASGDSGGSSGDGGAGGGSGNGGPAPSTSPDPDPLLTPPVIETPVPNANDNGSGNAPAPSAGLCGFGLFGMLPVMIFGLCWLKLSSRR